MPTFDLSSDPTALVAAGPSEAPATPETAALHAPVAPSAEPLYRTALWYKWATVAVVVVPLLGLIAACVLSWGWGFGWTYLGLLVGGWLLTGMGITVGFHRYFTHKSFDTGPVVTAVLGALGSMAVQGPLMVWAQNHRRHHQFSDRPGDVHSPHDDHGEGLRGWLAGAWYSHVGWLFESQRLEFSRYVPDLKTQPIVRFINSTFGLWALAGLILPALVAFAILQTWQSLLLGFLWGGLVRIFVVHHITWSVNSICHLFGTQAYESHDHSRNNPIVGILALGEGWHNNHHAFPASARHGLAWWQFDISYLTIRLLALFGLAWNVRVPSPERLAAKRISATR